MFRFFSLGTRTNALLITIVLVLVGMAGGILWYTESVATASMVDAGTRSSEVTDASSSGDDQDGTQILLGLARDAIHDGRLVAPAGSNAYEFYLSVLQLDPENRTAKDALRESFALAADKIEGTINQQQLEEARREIDLLREFDRNNFTLALLGGKLSAARAIVIRQHEAEAARIRETNLARQSASMGSAASTQQRAGALE